MVHGLILCSLARYRSSRSVVFCKKGVPSRSFLFNKGASQRPPICQKNNNSTHAFFCEFFEIIRHTIFYEKPPVAVSDDKIVKIPFNESNNNY